MLSDFEESEMTAREEEDKISKEEINQEEEKTSLIDQGDQTTNHFSDVSGVKLESPPDSSDDEKKQVVPIIPDSIHEVDLDA